MFSLSLSPSLSVSEALSLWSQKSLVSSSAMLSVAQSTNFCRIVLLSVFVPSSFSFSAKIAEIFLNRSVTGVGSVLLLCSTVPWSTPLEGREVEPSNGPVPSNRLINVESAVFRLGTTTNRFPFLTNCGLWLNGRLGRGLFIGVGGSGLLRPTCGRGRAMIGRDCVDE